MHVVHDGPGHKYGDPGYCGGCWWEQIGQYEKETISQQEVAGSTAQEGPDDSSDC